MQNYISKFSRMEGGVCMLGVGGGCKWVFSIILYIYHLMLNGFNYKTENAQLTHEK